MDSGKAFRVALPNGKKLDVFPIGKLAYELGRDIQTIRKWEIGGILPEPFFRGKNGKRLYSDEQIDIVVQEAEEHKIIRGRPTARTRFTPHIFKRWAVLKKEYEDPEGDKGYDEVIEPEKPKSKLQLRVGAARGGRPKGVPNSN